MEIREGQIVPGALAIASDGRLGTVRHIVTRPETKTVWYLLVDAEGMTAPLAVPAAAIESLPGPRLVRLRATGAEARTWLADQAALDEAAGRLRIPILEERVAVETRPIELGELRVKLGVETEEQSVDIGLTRDELEIERRPVGRVLEAPLEPHQDGEWLVIPIMREELVVSRKLVLAEELRIRKRQVTEEQTVVETLRRTRVEMEETTGPGGTTPLTGSQIDARAGETGTPE